MGRAKVTAWVVGIALLGVGGWAAYRAGWGLRLARRAPLVEYREVHFSPDGGSGRLLTIDSPNEVIVHKMPTATGISPVRAQLSCAEIDELPMVMKEGFVALRRSYGTAGNADGDQISLALRWGWIEKRSVWRNPPSAPAPPIAWDKIVSLLDTIQEVAEDTPDHVPGQEVFESDIAFEYGHIFSGIAGTQNTLLAIDKSGAAGFVARAGGRIQLSPEELSRLFRTIEDAKVTEMQRCYGRYEPVNLQETWMWYGNRGKEKTVTWMSPPADPKPPEGWSRIAQIADEIEARVRAQVPWIPAPPAKPLN